jgi:hypothetical protein
MKKYNLLILASLFLCVSCSYYRQFQLKTQGFKSFYVESPLQITKKFKEGIYLSQICKQTVLATDNRSQLVAFSPCDNGEVNDFDDPNLKQTIALIFLDEQRFVYCTNMKENGHLLASIFLDRNALENTKEYKAHQAHIFRGYYHVINTAASDTAIVLEMELPEKLNYLKRNNMPHKITISAILKDDKINFQQITHDKDKSDVSITNNDLNEIDLKTVFGFTPTFTFHPYEPALKEENIYIRSNKQVFIRKEKEKEKRDENRLEDTKVPVNLDSLHPIFDSFQWDSVEVTVNPNLGTLKIVHHIQWKPIYVKIEYRDNDNVINNLVLENKSLRPLTATQEIKLPTTCLNKMQITNIQTFKMSLTGKCVIDSSLQGLLMDNTDLSNYILNPQRYSKLTMRDYGSYQRFIFDNKFKPIKVKTEQQGKPVLYKTHLYIGAPANEVEAIFTEGNIRNYKLINGTIIKENINRRDSVRTW